MFKRIIDWLSQKKHYLYTCEEDYFFTTDVHASNSEEIILHSNKGIPLVTVKGKTWKVHKGYCHDGCTPRWKFGSISIGTWNGPNDLFRYPSLEHDVLIQLKDTGRLDKTLTYGYCNLHFFNFMKRLTVVIGYVYYAGVSTYTIVTGRWN